MKTIAVEEIEQSLAPTIAPVAVNIAPATTRAKLSAYLELTKPRITSFVVLTTAAGFFLGTKTIEGALDYRLFAHTLLATGLLCSGISALNQWMERDLDPLMRRTARRPLPAGTLTPRGAFIFGLALTVGAEIYLTTLVNPLSAVCGLSVIVGYLLC